MRTNCFLNLQVKKSKKVRKSSKPTAIQRAKAAVKSLTRSLNPLEVVAATDIAFSMKHSLRKGDHLPLHSPVRKVLAHFATRNKALSTNQEIADFLGISKTSVVESQTLILNDPTLSLKYPNNVKRNRLSPEKLDLVRAIQDELVPATSGRYFRVLHCCDSDFYSQYLQELKVCG